jgi:hypothetical protein
MNDMKFVRVHHNSPETSTQKSTDKTKLLQTYQICQNLKYETRSGLCCECIGLYLKKKRFSDLLHSQRTQSSTNFHSKHSLLRSEGAKMKEMFTVNL